MAAYYNEFDPQAAAWLRELIKQGHIADGIVDERSIVDVRPEELTEFTQCHFFAGIGVWSYALRRAGWPDDRPVWTGSPPCQPFSSAGQRKGFADERHLWPVFFDLIAARQPGTVFGEQVSSSEVVGNAKGTSEDAWLDHVWADLEGASYAVAPFDLPAAGFGAPHIRQRLFFVAERLGHAFGPGLEGHAGDGDRETGREESDRPVAEAGGDGGLADTLPAGRAEGRAGAGGRQAAWSGESGGLADAKGARGRGRESLQNGADNQHGGPSPLELDGRSRPADARPGPTNGYWRDADWLGCRDGKWRPVEPGTFPLAHGASARVGRLRGYGNAINAEVATAFVEAYLCAGAARDLL